MKAGDIVTAYAWGRHMRHLDGAEHVVTRVGRKWFYVARVETPNNELPERFAIATGLRDGGGYSSDVTMETAAMRRRREQIKAARERIDAWGLQFKNYSAPHPDRIIEIAERLGEPS